MAWTGKGTWSHPLRFARIGEYLVPRRVEWRFEGDKGDPDLFAAFEVRDGRPQCVEIRVSMSDAGRPVRTSDLQQLAIDAMTIGGFTRFAMQTRFDPETNVTQSTPVMDERDLWRALNDVDAAVRAPRRGVTRAELEEVARVYLANLEGQPTKAVELELGYQPRTAARRVKQAEEAGLLGQTTPGRRRTAADARTNGNSRKSRKSAKGES